MDNSSFGRREKKQLRMWGGYDTQFSAKIIMSKNFASYGMNSLEPRFHNPLFFSLDGKVSGVGHGLQLLDRGV